MAPRPPLLWRCRDRELRLGARPLVMGIVNVTPDSFSDGGRYVEPAAALAQARRLRAEGADLLDLGGESTRPGAAAVSAEEEWRRLAPVLEALAAEGAGGALLSVDTTKAAVARRALELGAHIINDISALTADPAMAGVARDFQAGVVLMHLQGTPRTMQQAPHYDDVVAEVCGYLAGRLAALAAAGLDPARLAVDPGIGFGKSVEHNLQLLAHLDRLAALGRPVLVGVSRKSFLGRLTGREAPGERLAGSLAAAMYALQRGAHIIRVHDVKESCDVAKLVAIFGHEETDDVVHQPTATAGGARPA